jgi:hypothetical protein
MTSSYTPAQPGTWLLLVTADSVLYAEAAAATAVDELWRALAGAAPVQSMLDILTRGGLGSTPSFALGHVVDGTLHALVRGPVQLAATSTGGSETIDGTGVSTWRETSIAGVTALRVGEGTGQLPLGSGVVWASGFAFQPSESSAAPPASLAASTTPPEPVAASIPVQPPLLPPEPIATPIAEPAVAVAAVTDLPAEHTMVEHTIVEPEDDAPPAIVPAQPEPIAPMPVAAEPAPAANSGYSHLFEETVHRSIEEAAIREPEHDEEAEQPAAPIEVLGDHDGETVMSADVAALRRRSKAAAPAPATPAARPVYLELPNDQREPLSQPVIIGRNPSVSQVSGTELPRLVSLPGSQDISRSHARFALEGDTVVVTDLHSRNGTTIALPGKPPQLLRKGEPTAVLPGTVVDLGGVVSLTVREG